MPEPGTRYTVAVDFDGVLHSYSSPWVDAATIPDPPVPGALEWLAEMLRHFDVAILSTRNHQEGGVEAMQAWLARHGCWDEGDRGVESITFPIYKPPALIYIDDRGYRFAGTFPTRHEIHTLRPWNKPAAKD
jgi:hypothetical protein